MPTAYPMLLRCARHQLREDAALLEHLMDWRDAELIRPNLLLRTGPHGGRPDTAHGTLQPILCLKAG